MNQVKIIIAAIPLVAGLAGPAMAEKSESPATAGADIHSGKTGAIESLLNHYAGLAPGDSNAQNPLTLSVPPSQQLSSFTGSAGTMSSYYTSVGVDRSATGQNTYSDDHIGSASYNSERGSNYREDSAAPAVSAITAVHAAADTLVGAVASAITPASSNGGYTSSAISGGDNTPASTPVTLTYTTTITATDATPVPIPAAAALFGSGLAALASLRNRNRDVQTA